jgi:hypothetical protein
MSGIRNQNVNRAATFAQKTRTVAIITALSLTSAVVYSSQPAYKYKIERIRSFCRTKAGTVTAVVKVGTRTAATITFTAATEVAQTLSTTLANLIGSSSEPITIELTTDGSGVLANAFIEIVTRPYPMNGDLGRSVA